LLDEVDLPVLALLEVGELERFGIERRPLEAAPQERGDLTGELTGQHPGAVNALDGGPAVAGEVAAAELLDPSPAVVDLGVDHLVVAVAHRCRSDPALVETHRLLERVAAYDAVSTHDLDRKVDDLGVVLPRVPAELAGLFDGHRRAANSTPTIP